MNIKESLFFCSVIGIFFASVITFSVWQTVQPFKVGTCIQYREQLDPWEIPHPVFKILRVGEHSYLTCFYKEDCDYFASVLAEGKPVTYGDSLRLGSEKYYDEVSCDKLESRK